MKIEHLWTPPAGERIVGVCQFRDHVYVATDCAVYRVTEIGNDVTVEPLQFDYTPPGEG